jgi:hypothetical protein
VGYRTLDEIKIVNNLSNYYWKSELTLTLGWSLMLDSGLMSKLDGDQNGSKVRSRLVSIVVKDGQN